LCGEDIYSGKNYEHRRGWIRNRLKELSLIFGVEVFSYAVMSNHLHIVIRNRPDLVKSWSDEEVVKRWSWLFPKEREDTGNPLPPIPAYVHNFLKDSEKLSVCRQRLGSLSWFMRCLNEKIARRANQEDQCSGRFWEGRFKSQPLLDEGAILACMAYVDLNPVRENLLRHP
jgi:REP element-mobilizing transposase RayT